MRSSSASPPRQPTGCPVCGCTCRSPSGRRASLSLSSKRRALGLDEDEQLRPPPLGVLHLASPDAARVGVESECHELRRALASQHQTIQELYSDLEEERSASSSAANEAMSMILRLQREKAEIQMEARQFRQFAEDKIAHDQEQIAGLEDECYRREQAIEAMLCEVREYRQRLSSYGIDITTNAGEDDQDYPQLRCLLPDAGTGEEMVEKYAAGDTPRVPGVSVREQLMGIEQTIDQMEGTGSVGDFNVMEKVVVGSSPRLSRHSRRISVESAGSFLMPEIVHEQGGVGKMDMASDLGGDDVSDRVYTIDAVHGVHPCVSSVGAFDDCAGTPRGLPVKGNVGGEEADIRKLYMRLQALEADRESLKQVIVSMRTEKEQMALLKEIAQNLSKGLAVAQPLPPQRIISKKPSFFGLFSFLSAFKFAFSFAFWTKKTKRCRYMFHFANGRVGLLLALDKSQHVRHLRCITRPITYGESSTVL